MCWCPGAYARLTTLPHTQCKSCTVGAAEAAFDANVSQSLVDADLLEGPKMTRDDFLGALLAVASRRFPKQPQQCTGLLLDTHLVPMAQAMATRQRAACVKRLESLATKNVLDNFSLFRVLLAEAKDLGIEVRICAASFRL